MTNSTYRPDIDGLRAVAVFAVIANHFNHRILPSGYLGVDIFFVISGYVITSSLLQKPGHSLSESLGSFYARRVKRIVPALLLFIAIMAVLICLFNPSPNESLQTGLAAVFGVSNLYLAERATDYFASSTQLNVFTHTWSLGVEEQFYLVFPLIFWICLHRRRSRKPLVLVMAGAILLFSLLIVSKITTGRFFELFPGHFYGFRIALTVLAPALLIPLAAGLPAGSTGINKLICILGFLSLASLLGFALLYQRQQPTAYFLMPFRFWELGAGSLLLLWSRSKALGLDPTRAWPALPIAVALILSLFLPLERGRLATISVVVLTCALIYCLHPGDRVHRLLSHRHMVKIGLLSYSLYLWHWGVLAISRWTIGIHAWSAPFQILLMLLAACASYTYIESPLRKANWTKFSLKTIGIGLASSVGIAALLSGLIRWGNALSLDMRYPDQWTEQLIEGGKEFQRSSKLRNRVEPKALEATLTHNEKGQELARPRLYILGDSHSEHYVSALTKALPNMGVGSASIGWQCGYISPLDINSQTKAWMANCDHYSRFVDEFLSSNLQPGDVVLVAHRWKEKKSNRHQETMFNHLAELTDQKGAGLILIDDVPEIDAPMPLLCNTRPWRPLPVDACFKAKDKVDADQASLDEMASRIEALHNNVRYARLRSLYCGKDQCGPHVDQMIIYRDTDHLTEKASQLGAAKLAPLILAHSSSLRSQ